MKCARCGKEHNRKKFCSNRCKDRYHNLHNPRGIFAHLHGQKRNNSEDDEDLVSGTWDEDGWLVTD